MIKPWAHAQPPLQRATQAGGLVQHTAQAYCRYESAFLKGHTTIRLTRSSPIATHFISHSRSLQVQKTLFTTGAVTPCQPPFPHVRGANLVCSQYRVYADLSLSRDYTLKPQRIDIASNPQLQPEGLFCISSTHSMAASLPTYRELPHPYPARIDPTDMTPTSESLHTRNLTSACDSPQPCYSRP